MKRRFLWLVVPFAFLVAAWGVARWMRAHGLSGEDLMSEIRRSEAPRFAWQSVDRRHWQASSLSPSEQAMTLVSLEPNGEGCPLGMVRAKGTFHSDTSDGRMTGAIERLQDAACTDWISRDFPARCRAFDAAKIAEGIAALPTTELDFCIDRFEYPNVVGQNPIIVVTFHEAEALCKREQKRLCTENEWTFACEGEEARPYPYGYTRDDSACVMDRPWRPFTEGALQPRDGERARAELDRLWQGEPSGARPKCRSPFGAYDMTGNVDEWTRSVNPTGYSSILKGGYWGPVRARCRPSTRAHNEDFIDYQQSFRCCAQPSSPPEAPETTSANGSSVKSL
ncbi:formylglycine-generating enzyme family protein [Pendulispora albinea]|uniref:Formylglycine-generating enzyme family protein n=1 Tax=Pendulispora albinea TaxID=2741071 RepID=A0ABZ2M7C6_9BACT